MEVEEETMVAATARNTTTTTHFPVVPRVPDRKDGDNDDDNDNLDDIHGHGHIHDHGRGGDVDYIINGDHYNHGEDEQHGDHDDDGREDHHYDRCRRCYSCCRRRSAQSSSSNRTRNRSSSIDRYSSSSWPSSSLSLSLSLSLLQFPYDYLVTVNHSSLWQKHVAWSKLSGKELKQYITQCYSSYLVLLTLMLATTTSTFFNSSPEIQQVRQHLLLQQQQQHQEEQTQQYSQQQGQQEQHLSNDYATSTTAGGGVITHILLYDLKFWIGMVLVLNIVVTLLGLLVTTTTWGMISSLGDEHDRDEHIIIDDDDDDHIIGRRNKNTSHHNNNAHCLIRSTTGSYVTSLPPRFVVASLYLCLLWVVLFIVDLVHVIPATVLVLTVLILFFSVVPSLSMFGRLILHTGAMSSSRPVLSPKLEQELLPTGLQSSLLIRAIINSKHRKNYSVMNQYNNNNNKQQIGRRRHRYQTWQQQQQKGNEQNGNDEPSPWEDLEMGGGWLDRSFVDSNDTTTAGVTTVRRMNRHSRRIDAVEDEDDDVNDLDVDDDNDDNNIPSGVMGRTQNNFQYELEQEHNVQRHITTAGRGGTRDSRHHDHYHHHHHRRTETMDTNMYLPPASVLNLPMSRKEFKDLVDNTIIGMNSTNTSIGGPGSRNGGYKDNVVVERGSYGLDHENNGNSKMHPYRRQPPESTTMTATLCIRDDGIIFHGGKKKGAAFTLTDQNMVKIKALNCSWFYGWTTGPPPPPPSLNANDKGDHDNVNVMSFLPMVWGYYPKSFLSSVEKVMRQNPSMILMFNEPDNKKQSNISVDRAVEAWRKLHELLNQQDIDQEKNKEHHETSNENYKQSSPRPLIVSPGCVHALGDWMKEFMVQIDEDPNLKVDVIAVHYYGGASSSFFRNHLRQVYETYNHRPIIVTEFAVADWSAKTVEDNKFTPNQVLQFMQDVLPWMQAQPWIIGYSWFSFSQSTPHGTSSALFVDNIHDTIKGSKHSDVTTETRDVVMTPLGRYYASFLSSDDQNNRESSDRFHGNNDTVPQSNNHSSSPLRSNCSGFSPSTKTYGRPPPQLSISNRGMSAPPLIGSTDAITRHHRRVSSSRVFLEEWAQESSVRDMYGFEPPAEIAVFEDKELDAPLMVEPMFDEDRLGNLQPSSFFQSFMSLTPILSTDGNYRTASNPRTNQTQLSSSSLRTSMTQPLLPNLEDSRTANITTEAGLLARNRLEEDDSDCHRRRKFHPSNREL